MSPVCSEVLDQGGVQGTEQRGRRVECERRHRHLSSSPLEKKKSGTLLDEEEPLQRGINGPVQKRLEVVRRFRSERRSTTGPRSEIMTD